MTTDRTMARNIIAKALDVPRSEADHIIESPMFDDVSISHMCSTSA